MNFSKPFGPSATETSEVEVEGNIRELTHGGAVFRQGENGDSESYESFVIQEWWPDSRRVTNVDSAESQT